MSPDTSDHQLTDTGHSRESMGFIFTSAAHYAEHCLIKNRKPDCRVSLIGNCHRLSVEQIIRAINPNIALDVFIFSAGNSLVKDSLEKSDFIITTDFPHRDQYKFPTNAHVVHLPPVYFSGFHPDVEIMQLAPLDAAFFSSMQSRIIMECFFRGYSTDRTRDAFCTQTYERLGYFQALEHGIKSLAAVFEQYSLDLLDFFPQWLRRGVFMYMPHHPKIFVFIDIIMEIMRKHGVPIKYSSGIEEFARDCLWGAPTWPVYPEIAYKLGLPEAGSLLFKLRETTLTLEEYIDISFAAYRHVKLERPKKFTGLDF